MKISGVRGLPEMVTLSLAIVAFAPASVCRADATADASGTFGEGVGQMQDDDSGLLNAMATVSNVSSFGDSYSATASVQGPVIRLSASGTFGSFPNGIGFAAQANSQWTDRLQIENPEVVQQYGVPPEQIFFLFDAIAEGGGTNGEANFEASGFDGQTFASDEAHADYGDGGSFTPLTLSFVLSGAALLQGIDFQMSLGINVGGAIVSSGESANLNFANTAFLRAIVPQDASGNPITELAGVRIVGTSGISYPVAVPEPSGLALAVAMVALLFARRRG